MRRKIILHGKLKELYDGEIQFYVDSVAEAIRALCYQVKGFKEEIVEGHYRVYIGGDRPENSIDESVLNFNLGDTRDIHIQPVLEGAKGGGGKIIAGIALVALSFATGGAVLGAALGSSFTAGTAATAATLSIGIIGKIGIAVALGGIAQLLTPEIKSPEAVAFDRPDQRASFLFNGPVNTTAQGGPIPLVYGTMRVGSTVVSASLAVEKI